MSGDWWLVVRVYRNKRRVLAICATREEAEAKFSTAEKQLRDGDLILAFAQLDTRVVRSGGYNRTRW